MEWDRPGRSARSVRIALAVGVGIGSLGLSVPGVARGDTYTWNDTTDNWSVSGDWSPSGPPPSDPATALVFGASSGAYTATNDIGPFTLNSLTLNGGAGLITIAGSSSANTLNFGGTTPTISLNGGSATLTAGIVYADGSQVNNTGPGTLTLGAETFDGTVTITNSGSGSIKLSDGVTYSGTNATINLANTGGGTFTIGNLAANLSGTLNITAGTVAFSGNTGGDLFGDGLILNVASGATFNFANNGESFGGLSGAGNVILGSAGLTFDAAGDRAFSGSISGTGKVTQNNASNLTLSGASTYTGGVGLNKGTITYAGDPVTSATTGDGAYPTGTITSSPFGTGTVTFNGGTLSVDLNGTNGNRTLVNALSFAASTSSTVNIPDGAQLTTVGKMTGTGTVTKTGNGLWRIAGTNNSTAFTGVLNINGGNVLLTDITNSSGSANSTSGDLNVTAINVNNGGTFTFGSNPAFNGENPDLPNTTYINVAAGGNVVWNISEDYGGINLVTGSTVSMLGNMNMAGTTASVFQGGTINAIGGTPSIGGAGTINKTTTDTLTVNGVDLNTTNINIQQGTIATSGIVGGSGTLAFGTSGSGATAGTLHYTGTGGTITKAITFNGGGGTISVDDPYNGLYISGIASGTGPFTKDGPGLLTLLGNNTNTGGTTIANGTLQLGLGGTIGAIVGDVTLGSAGTLVFDRGDDITFAGNISGAGGVQTIGGDTVTLTGAPSYTGPTTVSSGALRIRPFAAGPISVAGGASLIVSDGTAPATLSTPLLSLDASGSTLRFELSTNGNPAVPLLSVTTPNGLNLNGGANNTLSVVDQGTLSVGTFTLIQYAGSPISSGFQLAPLPARTSGQLVYDTADDRINLQVTGTDSIKWNGNVSADWDTGTAINQGGTMNWRLASDNSPTNFVANDLVVFDDSATGTTVVNLPADVQPALVTVNNSAKDYTLQGTGTITGPAALVKQGTGTLTLLTNNSYTGGTTVSGGTLQIGNGATDGAIGTGDLLNNAAVIWNNTADATFPGNVSGGGSLTKQGSNNLTLTGAFTPTGTTTIAAGMLTLASDNNYEVPGQITGAGGLTKDGQGTISLTAANTYTGGTTVAAGTLQIGNGGTSGSILGDTVVSGTLAFNRADALTYAGNISGSGKVAMNGTGSVTLSGTLSYAGATTVNSGTLTLTGNNTMGAINVAPAGTLTVDTTGFDQTYSAVVSGSGTMNKTGPNTLTLTASNTFLGTLNINGGTVLLSDPGAGVGTSGDINAVSIVVNNGGAFQFGQGGISGENPDLPDSTIITVNPGGNVDWRVGEQLGGVNLQGGTVTLDGGSITSVAPAESWTAGTLTAPGTTARSIGGSAVINKTTAGTVTVSGAATIGSTLNIQEGTVAFAAPANLGTAAITLGTSSTSGTFEYQGTADATRSGTFTYNGPGTIQVDSASNALTLSGTQAGSGSLSKAGPGTLILTGNNTISGSVSIAAGTLAVNGQTGTNSGTGTGPVTINPGGVLAGNGIAKGAVVVNASTTGGPGGTIAPGSASATANLTTGAQTWSGGSDANGTGGGTYAWKLNVNNAGTPGPNFDASGTNWDHLSMPSLSLSASSAQAFNIQVTSFSGPAGAAFDPSQTYQWAIASVGPNGSITNFSPSALHVIASNFVLPGVGSVPAGRFSVDTSTDLGLSDPSGSTDLMLVFSPAPEPTSLLLTGLGAAGLLLLRRRRQI